MSDLQGVPLASLDLLRQITDRHVIDQLLSSPTMTRAEIAAQTGISKPTISESVRRLADAGVLTEAGPQLSGRRGRTGLYYALRDDLGIALAVSASPDGLVAETLDVRGGVLRRLDYATPSPVTASQLNPLLLGIVVDALADVAAPVRAAALSIAGPVDRDTGRLVHLPNSPFLVDELDSRELLGPTIGASLMIDNDVNWAAMAEFHEGVASDLTDFCYLHLGHGLGGAVIRNGEPVRGHTGLAGEPAHMVTVGPRGKAMRLVECFGALDLLHAGSAAIDVARVGIALQGDSAAGRRVRDTIVDAVAGVIGSTAALLNPAGFVVGGPWSTVGDFAERLADRVDDTTIIPVDIRLAALGASAPISGVRRAAVRAAQNTLLGPLAKEIAG